MAMAMVSRFNGSFDESDNSTLPCGSYTYDTAMFQETIVQVRETNAQGPFHIIIPKRKIRIRKCVKSQNHMEPTSIL